MRERWRAIDARGLNREDVRQMRRMSDCEDFVCKPEEFVFDVFGYFDRPVNRE